MRHSSLMAFIGIAGLMAVTAQAAETVPALARVDATPQDFCKTAFSTVTGSKVLEGAYVGQCKSGLPQGEGTVKFNNGDRYQGAFAHGKIEGRGTWTYANGSEYSGEWREGKRHGTGTYQWGHGSSYAGDWFYDRRHGMGTLTWSSGDKFEGEFRNNKYYAGTFYTAKGKLTCMDGQCR